MPDKEKKIDPPSSSPARFEMLIWSASSPQLTPSPSPTFLSSSLLPSPMSIPTLKRHISTTSHPLHYEAGLFLREEILLKIFTDRLPTGAECKTFGMFFRGDFIIVEIDGSSVLGKIRQASCDDARVSELLGCTKKNNNNNNNVDCEVQDSCDEFHMVLKLCSDDDELLGVVRVINNTLRKTTTILQLCVAEGKEDVALVKENLKAAVSMRTLLWQTAPTTTCEWLFVQELYEETLRRTKKIGMVSSVINLLKIQHADAF